MVIISVSYTHLAFTTPFPPGAIGSLVQSATAQAQEVVTLVSTNGWFPVLVDVYKRQLPGLFAGVHSLTQSCRYDVPYYILPLPFPFHPLSLIHIWFIRYYTLILV